MKPRTITSIVTVLGKDLPVANIKGIAPSLVIQKQPALLAAALAHEVRNPLANIALAAKLLQETATDDNQKKYLDIIVRGSVRINEIVTDLLTPVQPHVLKPEKYSVQKLLDEVLTLAADRILLKKVTVIKEYTNLDFKILATRKKLKFALTNIIINAIEAMHPENGQLKLSTKSMNGKCLIEIEDNGIGISKENLKNIFKPYYTNKPDGMGLGLSTTLDILFSNHALVDVQSEEGRGTRFILSFDSAIREVNT
jgi:signal transduction histidine kinase